MVAEVEVVVAEVAEVGVAVVGAWEVPWVAWVLVVVAVVVELGGRMGCSWGLMSEGEQMSSLALLL